MTALDTNVLVYAHRRETAEHQVARTLIHEFATGSAPWAIPWPCLYEFFSVVTHPRIWKDAASTPSQAWRQIQAWVGSPSLTLLAETEGFAERLETLACRGRVRGPIIHDARVAALCLAHGVGVLLSRDRDFSLFPELPVRNPFQAA